MLTKLNYETLQELLRQKHILAGKMIECGRAARREEKIYRAIKDVVNDDQDLLVSNLIDHVSDRLDCMRDEYNLILTELDKLYKLI